MTGLAPILARLIADGRLRCSRCAAPALVEGGRGAVCRACGADFPAHHGVLDLFDRYSPGSVPADPVFAARVRESLELPDDPATLAAVGDVLARAAGTDDIGLSAEIHDIADRFGLSGGEPVDPEPTGPVEAIVERHYVPRALRAGDRTTACVRLRNVGSAAWPAGSRFAATIGGTAGGHGVVPVAIGPGRAVTVPMPLKVPRRVGEVTVEVGGGLLAVEVDVTKHDVDHWSGLERRRRRPGYEAEHREATDLLAAALPPGDGRRLLEIGGGTHPQLAWLGRHDVVDIDISLPLLELGSLWFAARAATAVAARIGFLCADATSLPFEDGSFDAVAMYATLHHFARPEALLAECRRVVGPGGVVAILCEPVGSSLEEPDIIRDLSKGINEQVFTIDEYRRIAAAAGLDLERGVLAGGSLQAILRPVEPSGEAFDVDVAGAVR